MYLRFCGLWEGTTEGSFMDKCQARQKDLGDGEQRGYQPPVRPGAMADDSKKLETGYVPPSRPVDVSKKK